MLLHEFQAKELLERFGIAIPAGRVVSSPAEAERAATRLGVPRFAVKAQVRATDRRAVGGVRFSASPSGVAATAQMLIGAALPVGPSGLTERTQLVLVEEAIQSVRQVYLALVLDRASGGLLFLSSRAGGEGIESRILHEPELMVATPVAFEDGQPVADLAAVAAGMGLSGPAAARAADVAGKMVRLACDIDATQVEINPLAVTADGTVVALDGKIVIDDNALFRHPALRAFRDVVEEEDGDPEERAADLRQLNYTVLDGSIGLVANGAGLGLVSLDLIVEAGGRPANFMDIRTTASSLDIAYGFGRVLANPAVRAILVNVHGGGMQRCDTIAEGLQVALGKSARRVPIIVRMAGNNADFALQRLRGAGAPILEAADMEAAARLAVRAAGADG
ncbi:MAG: ATP-grasp domain-containing protein [Hyphomicrobiaceae bacterium]|nr:ATP-grasp domain-containing protein [Hyphomicrobiaceae bacterium]